MGRSKKILTEFDIECRKKTGLRLEALKKERGYSIVSLAKELHINDSTLRNYMKGRKGLDPDVAAELERKFGKIALYWSGQTDTTTWAAYYREQAQIEGAAAEEYAAMVSAEIKELSNFFSYLGYNYQNVSGSAEYDFAVFLSQSPYKNICGPHCISDSKAEAGTPVYLSQEDLDTLLAQLRDTIGYFCYKKSNSKQ